MLQQTLSEIFINAYTLEISLSLSLSLSPYFTSPFDLTYSLSYTPFAIWIVESGKTDWDKGHFWSWEVKRQLKKETWTVSVKVTKLMK